MERIKIEYQPYVPEIIIREFIQDFSSLDAKSVKKEMPWQRGTEHFDHQQLIDLVIHFYNSTGLLRDIFDSVGKEIVKEALKTIFSKWIEAKKIKRKQSLPSMDIHLEYQDVKAKFHLSGNFTDRKIDKCFQGFTELISNGTVKENFGNSDYHKLPGERDEIKYYLSDKGLWVPYDFFDEREQLQKRIQELGH